LAASVEVQKGTSLSKILAAYPNLYLPIVTQMIEVGEETGTLGEITKRLAEFYEEEVSNVTKSLSTIIEPILMVVIGAAVGFFAVSMIQPMYSMMNAI
jgi:type IV pilus assembly protein PilC